MFWSFSHHGGGRHGSRRYMASPLPVPQANMALTLMKPQSRMAPDFDRDFSFKEPQDDKSQATEPQAHEPQAVLARPYPCRPRHLSQFSSSHRRMGLQASWTLRAMHPRLLSPRHMYQFSKSHRQMCPQLSRSHGPTRPRVLRTRP